MLPRLLPYARPARALTANSLAAPAQEGCVPVGLVREFKVVAIQQVGYPAAFSGALCVLRVLCVLCLLSALRKSTVVAI